MIHFLKRRTFSSILKRDLVEQFVKYCREGAAKQFNYLERRNCRHAAVILPIVTTIEGRTGILFEVRAKGLRQHGGEISFPGGFLEKGETPWQAGKREFYEELGCVVREEDYIGSMGDWHNRKSDCKVTVLVTLGSKIDKMKLNKDEVEDTFVASLDDLMGKGRMEYRHLHEGWPPVPFYYPDGKHVIWGFTGFVLDSFLANLKTKIKL